MFCCSASFCYRNWVGMRLNSRERINQLAWDKSLGWVNEHFWVSPFASWPSDRNKRVLFFEFHPSWFLQNPLKQTLCFTLFWAPSLLHWTVPLPIGIGKVFVGDWPKTENHRLRTWKFEERFIWTIVANRIHFNDWAGYLY